MNSRYLLLPLLLAFGFDSANAQEEDDIDVRAVIEARQFALREIGDALKGIMDEMRKSQPALPKIRELAQRIDARSKHQHEWFPEGTGQDADVINAAKDVIWERFDDFKAGQAAMRAEATKLVSIAAGNDVGAIRKQAQALGRTCKACHDTYREED